MTTAKHSKNSEGARRPAVFHLIHKPDLKISILILVVCAVLYYWTTTFEKVPVIVALNIPGDWFPRLLIYTIAFLALIIPFEHLFFQAGKAQFDDDRKNRIKPLSLITAGLLIFMVMTITLLGTYIAMILTTALMPLLWGERRIKIMVPYVIIFPFSVWFVFTYLLKVYFEPGMLFEALMR